MYKELAIARLELNRQIEQPRTFGVAEGTKGSVYDGFLPYFSGPPSRNLRGTPVS